MHVHVHLRSGALTLGEADRHIQVQHLRGLRLVLRCRSAGPRCCLGGHRGLMLILMQHVTRPRIYAYKLLSKLVGCR